MARPLSKTEPSSLLPSTRTYGAHSRPVVPGSLQRVSGDVGQPLADPGAAAGLAEDRAALVGGAGAGRPVGVGHQVGDRARAAGRCRSGRRRARAGGPASRAGSSTSAARALTSTSARRAGAGAGPGRAGAGCGLAVDLGPGGRLDEPGPQPGRGGQVGRREGLLGVAEQLLARRSRPARSPRRAPRRTTRAPRPRARPGPRRSRRRPGRRSAARRPRPGRRPRPRPRPRRPARRCRRPGPRRGGPRRRRRRRRPRGSR